jgi:hypothetical protein
MQNELRVLNDSELDAVCGAMINLASNLGLGFHGGPRNTYGGASGVGHGDTIDSGPAGAWGTINNNLPGGSVGQGPWGN